MGSQDLWDEHRPDFCPPLNRIFAYKEDPLDAVAFVRYVEAKQMVSHRLLAYDTTNFYTYNASSNGSNLPAQREHNKQGRHNLRQLWLSYVLIGKPAWASDPGRVADVDEFSTALVCIIWMLDQSQMERENR